MAPMCQRSRSDKCDTRCAHAPNDLAFAPHRHAKAGSVLRLLDPRTQPLDKGSVAGPVGLALLVDVAPQPAVVSSKLKIRTGPTLRMPDVCRLPPALVSSRVMFQGVQRSRPASQR